MDLSSASVWWIAAGVAVAAELATGTFYLLMIALGLGAGADRRAPRRTPDPAPRRRGRRRRRDRALALAARRASRAPGTAAANRDVNLDIGERVNVAGWAADRTARVSYRGSTWAARLRPGAPPPGEHVVAAVEGNWLVLAPASPLTEPEIAWNLPSKWRWSSPSSPRSSSSRPSRSCRSRTPGSSSGSASTTARSPPASIRLAVPRTRRLQASLKEVPLDVPSQVCITRDNTQLQVDGIIYFQVTDPMRASYGSSNYISAITQLAQTLLRSVIGKMELDKTFEERDHINLSVVAALDEAAQNWGVKVLRYEIKDLTPPAAILHAMQAQITAEREKRALIAASEGRKQEQINIATGEREAYIARSEGQRQAEINQAKGEAAAIVAVAEATLHARPFIGLDLEQLKHVRSLRGGCHHPQMSALVGHHHPGRVHVE